MKFEIKIKEKSLIFDSELQGLLINGREYRAGKDGRLIYYQISGLKSNEVELQMSSNTSTIIPALKCLKIPYNKYFDNKDVVNSQNDITFYWEKSKLAAFYNKFSTDDVPYEKREPIIKKAIGFITKSIDNLPLNKEFLNKIIEPVKLLGFYKGFPIFDSKFGFAKLKSRLGIHVGDENIMISTPLDKYESDVYDLAKFISTEISLDYSKKKNRVVFERIAKLDKLLGI